MDVVVRGPRTMRVCPVLLLSSLFWAKKQRGFATVLPNGASCRYPKWSKERLRMGHDEDAILAYLAKFPGGFVSPVEVCKRAASRKRFNENPDWAKALLARMAQAGVLESNAVGHYRIKVREEKEEEPEKEHREYSSMTAEDALGGASAPAAPVVPKPGENPDLPKKAA